MRCTKRATLAWCFEASPFFLLFRHFFLYLNLPAAISCLYKIPKYLVFFVGLPEKESFGASGLAICFSNICPLQMLALTRDGLQRASCVLTEGAYLQGGGGGYSSHSHLNEVIASRRRRRERNFSHRLVRNGWAGLQ